MTTVPQVLEIIENAYANGFTVEPYDNKPALKLGWKITSEQSVASFEIGINQIRKHYRSKFPLHESYKPACEGWVGVTCNLNELAQIHKYERDNITDLFAKDLQDARKRGLERIK